MSNVESNALKSGTGVRTTTIIVCVCAAIVREVTVRCEIMRFGRRRAIEYVGTEGFIDTPKKGHYRVKVRLLDDTELSHDFSVSLDLVVKVESMMACVGSFY